MIMGGKKSKVISLYSATESAYNAANERLENIIGKRIDEARKKAGLSLSQFSLLLKQFGVSVSPSGINKWTTGSALPNAYQLVAICYALDLDADVSYFVGDYTPLLNEQGLEKIRVYRDDLIASGRYRPPTKTGAVIKYVEKPVSNLPVSAGVGEFLDDSNFEMISFPENSVPDGAEFGIRVSGNSMEPVYHDGQIVWVQKCEHLAGGEVGIFIYDGEGYLKVYSEQEPDDEDKEAFTDSYGCVHPQPVLISYNQTYAPKIVKGSGAFQIVGRVL